MHFKTGIAISFLLTYFTFTHCSGQNLTTYPLKLNDLTDANWISDLKLKPATYSLI